MVKKKKAGVLQWFNSHTFHHSRFEDLARLVELKKKQGVKISVGIPTLNEEANIGNVISTLMPLVEEFDLVDEIAVIDSGSSDKTCEIARKAGAKVFISEKHLKDQGVFFHKGENLWKSLHMLKGDIICWVDADIENIHQRFVYGLLGPMLENEKIGYVKAFYERPIQKAGELQSTGGGRVTEIFARPMFNTFYPELTGIIQPLSGEYAGRRDVFEKVPFFIGYGVETGLLIDIFNKFGLGAMAQVDLDVRIHRNQPTKALGRMSFGLLQVFLTRVPELKPVLKDFNAVYRFPEIQVAKDGEKEYFLSEKEVKDVERPPIKGVSEYQMRKGFENDLLAKLSSTLWDIKKGISGKGGKK
ncbi:MAG: glucosyl-3-phosphoglycerate synthase [archaeon]|jgi:glucosyl-3-phosphoglycerate synthase|nr:glucosyl-3-phosphoglycerate synthase [archaeon]